TVSVSPPAPVYGQAVTFTATVSAAPVVAAPTGTVQFQVDGVNFGAPVSLVGGGATSAPDSALAAGNHTITAIYANADGSFVGGTGTLAGGLGVAKAPLTVTADPKSKV